MTQPKRKSALRALSGKALKWSVSDAGRGYRYYELRTETGELVARIRADSVFDADGQYFREAS